MTPVTPLALMFTDMVGSSAAKRAAELSPDASTRDRAYLASIQAKHLRLVRGAVAEFNGAEIMTLGDSFFLTFANPVNAILCAVAIQNRLQANPIDTAIGPVQLRIGVHIGTPEYFENSWHGTDVDIAARTEAAGSPGQIIVTDSIRKATGDLPNIIFRPLGNFALRGVGDVKLWDADYDEHGIRRPLLRSNEQKRRNRITVTAAALIASLTFLISVLVGRCSSSISITSPSEDTAVHRTEIVRGKKELKEWFCRRKNYLVIEAINLGQWYVQDRLPQNSPWSMTAYFGDASTPPGTQFSLFVLSTTADLKPGPIDRSSPSIKDAIKSAPIGVKLASP